MNRLRNFGLAALLGVAGALVTSNYVCSNQNLIESTNHSGSSKNTSDSGKIETIPSYTVKNNFDSGIEKDVSEDSFLPNIKINPDRLRDFPKVEEETYVGVDGFNYRTPDYWTWKSIADNELDDEFYTTLDRLVIENDQLAAHIYIPGEQDFDLSIWMDSDLLCYTDIGAPVVFGRQTVCYSANENSVNEKLDIILTEIIQKSLASYLIEKYGKL